MRIAPVFDLVKTLTDGELKLLKKRAHDTDAAYLDLLRIFKNAVTNNEAVFKKQFAAKHPEINYTETKSYLYKFLLRVLTEIHHEQNVFTRINFQFVTADVLFQRGLAEEAYSIYKHCKTLAEEESFFLLSAVALKRMQNVRFKLAKSDKEYALLDSLSVQETEAIEKDREASVCMHQYIRFVQLIEKYGGPTSQEVLQKFEAVAEHPVIKNYAHLRSKQARLISFDLLSNYYRFTGQRDAFTALSVKELKHYTSSLIKDSYYAYRYIFVLHNLINALPESAAKRKYQKLLQNAPTPNANTADYKRLFLLHASLSQLAGLSATDYDKVLTATTTELSKSWLQQKPKERLDLVIHLVSNLVHRRVFDKAYDVLLPELNNKQLEKTLPAQYIGLRFFFLLILYEQKRFDQMESPLRGLNYALKKNSVKNMVAFALANLFMQLQKNKNNAQLKRTFQRVNHAVAQSPNFTSQLYGINTIVESAWFQQLNKPSTY